MNEKINIKEIERRAYLTYHKDGIIDIFIGLGMAMMAFQFASDATSMVWMLALFPIFYRDSKRRYTIPRLGYVKFSEKQGRAKISKNLVYVLLSLAVLTTLGLWYSATKGNFALVNILRPNFLWLSALLSLGLFSIFGYVTELQRLYYYGVGSFVIFALSNFISINVGWILAALGGIMAVNGFFMLQRFMREYPIGNGVRDE